MSLGHCGFGLSLSQRTLEDMAKGALLPGCRDLSFMDLTSLGGGADPPILTAKDQLNPKPKAFP